MHKKHILLFTILAMSFFINAQVTTVLGGSNVDEPRRLLLIGDELYFSEDERVSKFNVTDISPTRITVVEGFDRALGMALKGNDLYIADFFGSRVRKIDITDTSPVLNHVTSIGQPNILLINNDDLYYTDNDGDDVYVYDLTTPDVSPQVFSSQFSNGPIGIEKKDNFIYITEASPSNNGKLYRLDINNPVPIELLSGLERPIGIKFRGNDLYIAELDGDKIVKVDITQDPLIIEDVVNVNNPRDITFYNDIMYIATTSKISKVDLTSLDINEFENINKIKLFPNPAKENITISNLKENKAYTLFDINGRVLKSGKLELSNSNINVADLAAGTYILRIEDSNFKFIKI